MITRILKPKNNFNNVISTAINLLRNDNIIAFPTETVYGIGARLFSNDAVRKIYEIKQRSYDKPLSVFIVNLNEVNLLSDSVPDDFYILSEKFLPGPLTIIINCSDKIKGIVTGGLNTIGIRMPDNKIAFELGINLMEPIAATSANISGKPSARNIKEVLSYFNNKIPAIIDGGESVLGIESTVIKLTGMKYEILREGVIKKTDIEDVLKKKII
jgi:L-threonylcarbamoyladenylate synthase